MKCCGLKFKRLYCSRHNNIFKLVSVVLRIPTHKMASFKPSLVEHIFRSVWTSSSSSADAHDSAARDTSHDDDDSVDEIEIESADASRVTKISQDALKLSSELLRVFALEALRRAQMEAMVDDSPAVEPHHVEQILAQLLLDF